METMENPRFPGPGRLPGSLIPWLERTGGISLRLWLMQSKSSGIACEFPEHGGFDCRQPTNSQRKRNGFRTDVELCFPDLRRGSCAPRLSAA